MRYSPRRALLAAALSTMGAFATVSGAAAAAQDDTHSGAAPAPGGAYCLPATGRPAGGTAASAPGVPCADPVAAPRSGPATDTMSPASVPAVPPGAPAEAAAPRADRAPVTVPAPRTDAVQAPPAVAGASAAGTGTWPVPPPHTRPGVRPGPPPGPPPGPQPRQLCGPPYIADKPELGPVYLPRRGLLGSILRGYTPLGGLPPWKFLYRYQDEMTGFYRYPPYFGFATSGGWPNGRPLVTTVTLPVGRKLDRFGGEGGSFLAPFGGSYVGRALPPSNLNTFPAAPEFPCSYHAYTVLKSFRVDAGPAAPAFQLRGGGVQYHLLSKYIPEAPQVPAELPVSWLVANGYLEPFYVPA